MTIPAKDESASGGDDPFTSASPAPLTDPPEDESPEQAPATYTHAAHFAALAHVSPERPARQLMNDLTAIYGREAALAAMRTLTAGLGAFGEQLPADAPVDLIPIVPTDTLVPLGIDPPTVAEVAEASARDFGRDDTGDLHLDIDRVADQLRTTHTDRQRYRFAAHARAMADRQRNADERALADTAAVADSVASAAAEAAVRTAGLNPARVVTLAQLRDRFGQTDSGFVEVATAIVHDKWTEAAAAPKRVAPVYGATLVDLVRAGGDPAALAGFEPLTAADRAEAITERNQWEARQFYRRRTDAERRARREDEGDTVDLTAAVFDYDRRAELMVPPVDLITSGQIRSRSVVQIAGPPNTFKSFLALSFSCALTAEGRAVIYLAPDDDVYEVVRRVAGWCVVHDVDPARLLAGPTPRLRIVSAAAYFSDPEHMALVADWVRDCEAAMVVFDTQHLCSAGLSENSADDARTLVWACKRLARLGPAVLLIHHTAIGRTTGSARGTNAIEGGITARLTVTKTGSLSSGTAVLTLSDGRQKNQPKRSDSAGVTFGLTGVTIPDPMADDLRIAERDRDTLAVRVGVDPMDAIVPPTFDAAAWQLYGLLWAIAAPHQAPTQSAVIRDARDHLRPLLIAQNWMAADAKQMPNGMSSSALIERLKLISRPGELVTAVTLGPNGTTFHYQLTETGHQHAAEVAAALGVPPPRTA
ncbi:AAA family ATPase [Gordonia sp. LSe1-13]|uniref:AAA family ATPase n=1 Tax=Gordonia sesuvii TaxID=3116777 RepID=A0ABU7MJC1_9ACTN|nr:AAA family ATPase [Gordonia sp. LSe1-13]